jgi:hypothetical protein
MKKKFVKFPDIKKLNASELSKVKGGRIVHLLYGIPPIEN